MEAQASVDVAGLPLFVVVYSMLIHSNQIIDCVEKPAHLELREIMLNKKAALFICTCLLIAAITGCGSRDGGQSSISAPSEVMSAPEVNQPADMESEVTTETERPGTTSTADAEPLQGTMRSSFALNYLVEDANETDGLVEKSTIFSFDLPAEWTIEATPYQAMLYNGGDIIGQIELQPRSEDISPLFSDIDARSADTYNTNELTVSGYPAKQYVLKSGAEGTTEMKPSYNFYIAPSEVPDAYILIFFLPDAGTENELVSIVSSLLMSME